MNVMEALNSRFSTRVFKSNPISQDILLKILEAANRTPSWANTQPWEVYIAGGETLDRIRKGNLANSQKELAQNPDVPAPQKWPEHLQKRMENAMATRLQYLGIAREDKAGRQAQFQNQLNCFAAPVIIYLCLDRSLPTWPLFDIGAYSMNITLAAYDLGLGSIPAFNLVAYPEVVRREMGIPNELAILIGIALGYSDLQDKTNKYRSSRRPVTEVAHFKGF
jgi:nitroreductase